jgi:Flp pilus assembly protein TadG
MTPSLERARPAPSHPTSGAAPLRTRFASALGRLRAILRDHRGVAAIEFAFIVPVFLCGYFVTMEATQGLEVNRKVARIAYSVGDLITQQPSIARSEVRAIMDIGGAVIQPYNRSEPTLEVTAIQFDNSPTPVGRVAWSMRLDGQGNPVAVVAKNTIVDDAELTPLRSAGAFFVRVTTRLAYEPVVTWAPGREPVGLLAAFSGINMGETFYLRPRRSTTIPCADCP